MPLFGIFLIIALIAAAGYLYYRYDLMKAYYKYQTKELETLEKIALAPNAKRCFRKYGLMNVSRWNVNANNWL